MKTDLNDTTSSAIASALVRARRAAGSPAMGMVLTLVIVTDEANHKEAMQTALSVSTEHPSRVLGVILRPGRGAARLDASIAIGNNASGESVLLRMSGELTKHAESAVLPLLLPDSPVVIWWPHHAPDHLADNPLGALAQRRIMDTASVLRGKSTALLQHAQTYTSGDSDLAWTRLTPWRALLAAALDQHPVTVTGGTVHAKGANPSADLLVAWLSSRLRVPVARKQSEGPGITSVVLATRHGDIGISRPDGTSATFTIPGASDRPVALKRRETAELLAEELRRLDEDDVYAETVRFMSAIGDGRAQGTPAKVKRAAREAAAETARTTTDEDEASTKRATTKRATTKRATTKRATAKRARSRS